MKLITQRAATLGVLQRCRASGCALFAPNGELAAEIEGLLLGGQRFAEQFDIQELPIAIGMTGIYKDNPQLRKISTYTAMAVGAGQKIYKLLQDLESEVVENNNLWVNSESFAHDVRRRHVAEVCFEMLGTLGYARLGAAQSGTQVLEGSHMGSHMGCHHS